MSKHLGVDGFPRTKDVDEKISQDVLALFNTPNGNAVLGYLKINYNRIVVVVIFQMENLDILKVKDI